MESVVGLIPNDEHVTSTMQEFRAAGFAENKMCVLVKPDDVWKRLAGKKKAQIVYRDTIIGALLGLTLGSTLGVVAGVLNCELMDCPIEKSLIFLALIMLFCTISGGLFGAIVGLDQLERLIDSYVEGVRHGQALFVVKTSRQRTSDARQILNKEHGTAVQVIHE